MYTRLPHRVTIQYKTTASWKGATFTTSWTNSNTVWANVSLKDKSAVEENYNNFKGQQFTYYNVILRNEIGIYKSTNRFVFDNKILHIETIRDNSNRGRFNEYMCRCEEVN